MPDFEIGRWPYADRHRVMNAVADALYRVPPPIEHDQGTVVIVRVTPPDPPEHRIDGVPDCVLERMEYWDRRYRELGR